jgi:hypothetical protein
MGTTPLFQRFWTGLALCGATALSIGTAGVDARQQRQERTPGQQRVYVSVVDKKGAPPATLAITDFTVKEDNVSREVIKVEPATDPMQIALLVDTSQVVASSISDLRLSVKAFGAAIWAKSPDTQIALYSFGERPALEADFSTSAANFDRRADRLFAASGSGAYLIDAIIDAAGALKKRGATRPVIVIGDVTTRTGGRSSTVFDGSAIKLRVNEVASQLLSQFALTYGRPDTLVPPEKLEIRMVNDELRIAAPRWTTR